MRAKKVICLLLTASIVMLAGCGMAKEAEMMATVEQKNMDESELAYAVEYIELMGVLAAVDSRAYASGISNSAFIGDIDSDGSVELAYGNMRYLIFNNNPSQELYHIFSQSGGFITDAENNFYHHDTVTGPEFDDDGNEIGWSYGTSYDRWDNGNYTNAYSKGVTEYNDETIPDKTSWSKDGYPGTEITQEEADAIGFCSPPSAYEYASYSFDASYYNHLSQSLVDSVSAKYPCASSGETDIDGDGISETIIAIPEILAPWSGNLVTFEYDPDIGQLLYNIASEIADIRSGSTAVLIISQKNDTATVTACGIPANVYDSPQNIGFSKYSISLGGYTSYIPSGDVSLATLSAGDRQNILSTIENKYIYNGCTDIFFKIADVADYPGDEILCFFRSDEGLCVDITTVHDGGITLIEHCYIISNSYFLVVHNGVNYILTYSQNINTGSTTTYSYSYQLFRYGTDKIRIVEDSQYISYNDSQTDASSASAFFDSLNVYLEGNLTVLYDSYSLTGIEWMPSDAIDMGTAPSGSGTSGYVDEEGQLGFVDIEEADSWLNLRVGPGTEYDRVLLDPNNPQSYIKQAKGSPVTVLEEIQTDDEENPVWVKIRIYYDSADYIGYSSKKYIRMANE